MKIPHASINGNETKYKENTTDFELSNSGRNENDNLNTNNDNDYVAYKNYKNKLPLTQENKNNEITSIIEYCDTTQSSDEKLVCNQQYRINVINKNNKRNSDENFTVKENDNKSLPIKLQDKYITYGAKVAGREETALISPSTDEMSQKSLNSVTRGIVNPNYPGFQHLAHTLQNFSANIEHFDQSENDMTDDDIDADIMDPHNKNTEELSTVINGNEEIMSIDMDNIIPNEKIADNSSSSTDIFDQMPDLLKTINKNNNNDVLNDCTTTDIENNFNTKDIIGDFNKEIEDEIRTLLNYNINIEDDLQELRKDIKETFAKPIENTINNISDVVNDVIKKLVENQEGDKYEALSIPESTDEMKSNDEDTVMREENESNTKTEKNVARPSFLLIDNHMSASISDAILSDGKEEINIQEYNTDALSHNVENTIKQLSTELRKIIPKLNEMRDRDKLWTENKRGNSVLTDGNFNNILTLSRNEPRRCRLSLHQASGRLIQDNITLSQKVGKLRNESRVRQSLAKSLSKVENNLSTRQDYDKEFNYECFDVYNIETALPKLDLDAIESHIKAAKEAERRKRNDREEIRKRLAMDIEADENYYSLGHTDRPGKKPSLHSRLQNGSKLRPTSLPTKSSKSRSSQSLNHIEIKEADFFALQATLQTEARIALAQAKELARVQMERERRSRGTSPVTEMLRRSVEKARVPLTPPRRRLSRQILTDLNIAQLQVIVNELHSQIEALNDTLVKLLMARDELHMGQDSMLVDIEDLTRYLGVKEQTKKTKGTTSKSGVRRLTSLVHK
ncbi:uncharacterized protein MAL13P1.304 isoform X2 [Aricia agestis]|uniref:uncharacterized protein MAL13P1.304 isoform X2 n=1 Tax=Aricia agestis TaxID=91739 RepID=UPI001C20BC0A|nr:uncharacterized protein MAL13P1.304 isoform X2 [Aricia agestis]